MTVKRNSGGGVTVRPRPDLLRRQPRTKPRMQSLDDLHQSLAACTELAENLGDGGRKGMYEAAIAVMDYLAGQGIPRATLYPFQLVCSALVDAQRGVGTPAFEPTKTGGRPPIASTEFLPRAHRVVVVECCILQKKQDGAKAYKVEGAELAAELLRRAGWKPDHTGTQLLHLREEVTARAPDDPIRQNYEFFMDSPLARARPLDWAQMLLTHGFVNRPPQG